MAKNKTKPTEVSVDSFLSGIPDEQKRIDSYQLIEFFERITGSKAYMWGPSIIGFGNYHYKYDSGHEGDAPVLGFSPRKDTFSLYVFTGSDEHLFLLEGLGHKKMGKACLYASKVADLDMKKLEKLSLATLAFLKDKYTVTL